MSGVEYRMPAPLNLEVIEDLYPQWLRFKQAFRIFVSAAGLEKITEARKASVLLNCIGQPAQELYFNTLKKDNTEDTAKLEEVITLFEEYFKPKSSEVINTWQFNKRIQEDGESFDSYYTELRRIAKNCNFDKQLDRMLRDRIVVGIREQRVQQKLLEIKDLTLERAVDVCRSAELSREHARVLAKQTTAEVDAVQRRAPAQHSKPSQSPPNTQAKYNLSLLSNKKYKCKKCNTEHGPRACPAYGQRCENCNRYNHFKVGCKLINQIECFEQENEEMI
ncbi:uncharacterized protein LOC134679168 [Cydia fagiglandana]|uniref:uncharacterized protein LOC134679168 n=1 Tax=Cydia fagiglandana TaxID=1458189 RepID=UPI002FEE0CFA